MITPGFSLTATERVLPRLALDFLTASLDPRVSVSRALNTATRVNSSGLVEIVNANLPRFDYDPITLACKGLLIEELRANLLLYSSDFTQSAWTKFQLNTSGSPAWTNVAVAPDGTQTADKLIANTVNNAHWVGGSSTITNGAAYTVSAYVRSGSDPGDYTFASLYDCNASTNIIVNLTTGALVSGTATAYTITPVGSGWYRLSVTATSSSTTGYARVYLFNGVSDVFVGNNTNGIYAWGIQLEAGAFATSYIPTTTTSLTRNADVVTMTGTNFTDWYNQAAGTFVMTYLETQNPIIAGGRMLSDTAQLRLPLYQVSTTQLGVYDPSTGGYGYNSGALVAGAVNRGATSWNSTTLYGCTNAGAVVSTAFDGNFDLSGLRIYSAHDNSTYKNGIVQKLAFYPQRLTNAELQAFTK